MPASGGFWRERLNLVPLQADFGGKEESWDLRARRCLGPLATPSEADPLSQATAIYEEGLQVDRSWHERNSSVLSEATLRFVALICFSLSAT